MDHPLDLAVRTAHAALAARLDLASAAMADAAGAREIIQKTDAFLVNACRHTAAMCDQVLPEARRTLPGGAARVRAYVEQCRRMERSFVSAKQHLYGEAHAVTVPWGGLWATATAEFRALQLLERDLVHDLATAVGTTRPTMADRLASVTRLAPTRPHPHSPHTGRFAHLTRGLWARADRWWDAAEGRIVTDRPAPVAAARLAS